MWKIFIKKHWLAITLCLASLAMALASYPATQTQRTRSEVDAVQNNTTTTESSSPPITQKIIATPKPTSSPPQANPLPPTTPLPSTSTPPLEDNSKISVVHTIPITITIASTTYDVQMIENGSVYDALQALTVDHNIDITYKNFGTDLGYMLQGINTTYNDLHNKYYWIYYVNGVKATIGISNNYLHSHDHITWQYEKETN